MAVVVAVAVAVVVVGVVVVGVVAIAMTTPWEVGCGGGVAALWRRWL